MSAAARAAISRLRSRAGRSLLAAAGIVAAAAMLGTAITVSYAFGTGFERSAERADLPDVIARFEEEQLSDVDRRVSALPNLASRSYRLEAKGIDLAAAGGASERGAVHIVRAGRRGYAVTEGRDLSGRSGEVLVERGVAAEWGVEPGEEISVEGLGPQRVVGISVSPDNVAFPLSSDPRIYLAHEGLVESYGPYGAPVNMALVWANDPARIDVTLEQARAVSYGLEDLRFLTQGGIRGLIDQAAGIVIALLVAFSLVALGSAALMLAAAARAEVERRMSTVGVLRALGFSRAGVVGDYALEATLLAAPAGLLGLGLGALAALGPTTGVLESLNQMSPGVPLVGLLALALVGIVAVVAGATAWPAWRAASRPPAQAMRGPVVGSGRSAPRRSLLPGGALGLGMRLVAARRARLAGTVAVLGAATGLVLLMLSLASVLERLQSDPGVIGKRYQLTANGPASLAPAIREIRGVAAAAPRYEVEAADSFELGEAMRLIAFPGDHTVFEAQPLAEGRRVRGDAEAEVGVGLADTLGLRPGSVLPAQLPSGAEVRFRVVGIVRALENEGRVAYVRPRRLAGATSGADRTIAIRLEPGASRAAVTDALDDLGALPEPAVGGATTNNARFLGTLADMLRAVAAVNGLMCLYALVQALALTALERRPAIAVLRAGGAGRRHLALVFGGAAALVVALAGALGLVLERLLLGPAVTELAADYAALPLGAGAGSVAAVIAGLAAVALVSSAWVGRRVAREPVVAGLRAE